MGVVGSLGPTTKSRGPAGAPSCDSKMTASSLSLSMAAAKPSWNSGTYRAGMWSKTPLRLGLLGNNLRPSHAIPDFLGARSTSCRHVMDSATLRRICAIRSPRLRPERVFPFADRLEFMDWRMLPASPPARRATLRRETRPGRHVRGSLRTIEQIQPRVAAASSCAKSGWE